jgi:K+-sensing histidine kinase KdpD
MPQTIDRDGARTRPPARQRRRHGGPVLLATFDHAPFEADAARVAVEAAADLRSTVYVVDVVRGARHAERRIPPAQAAALRDVVARATELGVELESLTVASRRPAAALLEVVEDRRPALIVLATDQTVLRRFRRPRRRWHRRFIRVFAEQTSCLLWVAQDPCDSASLSLSLSSRAKPAPMRRAKPDRATTIAGPTSSHIATTNGKRS